MPFTDPMADGPIIQAAGKRAPRRRRDDVAHAGDGARVPRRGRRNADHPDGLPQPDPVLRPERFCADAAAAGVDGLIVVDLPSEEADLLLPHAHARGHRLHPARRADHRRRAAAAGARRQLGLRLLRLHNRHHRHAQPPAPMNLAAGDPAHPQGARTCRSRSASACARPRRPPRRRASPTPRWCLGADRHAGDKPRRKGTRRPRDRRAGARPGARTGRSGAHRRDVQRLRAA